MLVGHEKSRIITKEELEESSKSCLHSPNHTIAFAHTLTLLIVPVACLYKYFPHSKLQFIFVVYILDLFFVIDAELTVQQGHIEILRKKGTAVFYEPFEDANQHTADYPSKNF